MDTDPGLSELRQRRAALLLESELNRQALRVEVMRVQMAVDRVRHGLTTGQNLWKWVAPIAGFLVARKFGQSGAVAKGSAVLAIGKALWSAWRDRRRPEGGARSSADA